MKLQDVDRGFCETRSRQGASRARLCELVRESMADVVLSDSQQQSLDVLRSHESVAVVTGQQVGLFGGPMYTLYKIRSAVAAASDVAQQTGVACVPVFWLEDNDHDAHEAMHAHLLVHAHDVIEVAPWDNANPRLRVAERTIDESLRAAILQASEQIAGRYAEHTRNRLQHAYTSGTSWTNAFISLLAPYLSAWGVLVIRSSKLVDMGLHGPVLGHLLHKNDAIIEAITAATSAIEARGSSAQAAIASIPWMYTTPDGRQRIERTSQGARIADTDYTFDELIDLARLHPERFTPTVLTRPMMQDAILPTVVSVLGAAEMAYHEQLTFAYPSAGLVMPALQLRSGMTLLTAKTSRNIAKSGRDIDWYRRSWNEIERDIAMELTHDLMPENVAREQQINDMLAPYLHAAESIDPTLVPTVKAQRAGIASALETLEAKLRSASKKKNVAMLERAHAIHASIFPHETLQERVYPLAMWESEFGIDALLQMCDSIGTCELGTHITSQASVHES